MKSLLTKLDRALVAVKIGKQHKDLPLASVKDAIQLLAECNPAEAIDIQRGGTYQDPDFESLKPEVLSTYFRRCAEDRIEKRRVEGTRLQREAIARDQHDTVIKPRDPAMVRGTPRDTRWTVDDEISGGKITNIYSGSASDYRKALQDLKSGKASAARQGLLALSSDLPKARVTATQETRVVALSEAKARRTLATADVMSDEQRRKQEKRRLKRAKRKLAR